MRECFRLEQINSRESKVIVSNKYTIIHSCNYCSFSNWQKHIFQKKIKQIVQGEAVTDHFQSPASCSVLTLVSWFGPSFMKKRCVWMRYRHIPLHSHITRWYFTSYLFLLVCHFANQSSNSQNKWKAFITSKASFGSILHVSEMARNKGLRMSLYTKYASKCCQHSRVAQQMWWSILMWGVTVFNLERSVKPLFPQQQNIMIIKCIPFHY